MNIVFFLLLLLFIVFVLFPTKIGEYNVKVVRESINSKIDLDTLKEFEKDENTLYIIPILVLEEPFSELELLKFIGTNLQIGEFFTVNNIVLWVASTHKTNNIRREKVERFVKEIDEKFAYKKWVFFVPPNMKEQDAIEILVKNTDLQTIKIVTKKEDLQ